MTRSFKEALHSEKSSTLLEYVEMIWSFLHEPALTNTQKLWLPFLGRKVAPSGLFCMSGPVAHADDDEDAAICEIKNSFKDTFHYVSHAVKKCPDRCSIECLLPNADTSVERVKHDQVITCLWSDGCLYEGEWGLARHTGRGKIFLLSGSVYDGEVMDGYLHGQGTYINEDGSSYEGSWVLNKKQGYGKKHYANGDVYQGFWKWDVPDGQGKYTWTNGNKYDGEWRGGTICGHGTLVWVSGDKYDGQWLNGLADGCGVYTWPDGTMHIGRWSRGLRFIEDHIEHADMLSLLDSHLDSRHSDHANSETSHVVCSPRQKVSSSSDMPLELRVLTHGLPTDIGTLLSALENDHEVKFLLGNLSQAYQHTEYTRRFYDRHDQADDDMKSQKLLEFFMVPLSSGKFGRHNWLVREPERMGKLIGRGHKNYVLMMNLQLGIRYSVGKITPEQKRRLFPSDFSARSHFQMKFPREGSALTPPHPSADFKWKDYCPLVFRHLRKLFKVDTADYILSICGNEGLREFSSPGKSGSIFYLSEDQRFMIKTLRKAEVKMFLKMLLKYYKHVCIYKNTLLTKFYGLYQIKFAGDLKVQLVVMGNSVSSECWIHRLYDLKGSSQGRYTGRVGSDNNITLKDLDLDFEFYLESTLRESVLRQISRDCNFLESQRIMDYSLLLGLHFKFIPPSRKFVLQEFSDIADMPLRNVVMSRFITDEEGFVETDIMSALISPNEEKLASTRCMKLGVGVPAVAYHKSQKGNGDIDSHESYEVMLFFGIIDILQEYDMGKKLEHAYKSLQFDTSSISAVDPAHYSWRFQRFMHQIFLKNKRPSHS